MIAALPMYDWDEVRPAMDRFWSAIRDRLRGAGLAAPDRLSRGADLWQEWQSPDLLLGQTCGLPYRTRLHGRVGLVGTLDYGLPDAPAGYYFSQIVVRAGEPGDWTDFIGRRLAINSTDSQSGWAALHNHAARIGQRFGTAVLTGSHRESARAVSEGRADIASIDAVTWRLVTAHDPGVAASLRVAARTEPTPGLPLITARGHDSALIGRAVADGIADLAPGDRAELGLCGLVLIPAERYLAVPTPFRT
jgi:ABC-type phosphate/phosphonate transport system substrate-binding protein